jgi:sugar phosphate isomerase/epimerase
LDPADTDLKIVSWAIGAFASQKLYRVAEHDAYPHYAGTPSIKGEHLMKMTRRRFLQMSGAAVVSGLAAPHVILAGAKDPMKRITMSTVTFRARFAQTRIKGHPPIAELKLIDVPEYWADRFKLHNVEFWREYWADRFKLHNVEFWSRHFESREKSYLKDLKSRITKCKSTLVNIQVDEPYNLAEADAEKRKQHVQFLKTWIDTAVTLGSKAVRANTGGGDLEACIRSFRELSAYAKERKVLFLVENHGGLSSDPEKLIQLVKSVDSKNLEILPDFGNFSASIRYEGLRAILPYAKHLISAKTHQFDASGKHSEFDFDRCVQMAKAAGFPGIYSAEYYDRHGKSVDYEKIADWMLKRLLAGL